MWTSIMGMAIKHLYAHMSKVNSVKKGQKVKTRR